MANLCAEVPHNGALVLIAAICGYTLGTST